MSADKKKISGQEKSTVYIYETGKIVVGNVVQPASFSSIFASHLQKIGEDISKNKALVLQGGKNV